jgi:hypothetical protein
MLTQRTGMLMLCNLLVWNLILFSERPLQKNSNYLHHHQLQAETSEKGTELK